jgi:hypothetical protein
MGEMGGSGDRRIRRYARTVIHGGKHEPRLGHDEALFSQTPDRVRRVAVRAAFATLEHHGVLTITGGSDDL